ncbi:uncharacterized protein LOC110846036 [Folsomia candida]|uniref:Bifunctional lycopene cyclase/phytoene synthase n=1 Tax=Folsomia candida TaxID=158441 RepID=A0A226EI63_FOLCA|nr:uncharacterized protein LOC110846036 [Folsomia candida]OXA56767.1 Bifunctional lycopene cyclase/phytoene synthase [Folsomia candida]
MGMNPCCCSLQSGVKAIAIFGMVKSTFLLVISIIALVSGIILINHGGSRSSASEETDSHRREIAAAVGVVAVIVACFIIAICLIYFALAVLLWKAAQNRNEKYSRIWLIITCILWVLALFQLFWLLSSGGRFDISLTSLQLLLDIYFIWVVMAFRKELLEQEAQGFVVAGGGGNAESGPSSSYKMEQ